MRQQSQPCSATSAASAGSWRNAVTSLTNVAPAAIASRATSSFIVSTLSCAPVPRERLDHRDDAGALLVARHGVRARPGRLAADVEDRRALLGEPAAVRDRRVALEPLARRRRTSPA